MMVTSTAGTYEQGHRMSGEQLTTLRRLFDSLDRHKLGFVTYAQLKDLAVKYSSASATSWSLLQSLPSNFVQCCHQVAPRPIKTASNDQSTILTFERFCAALRLALNTKTMTNGGRSRYERSNTAPSIAVIEGQRRAKSAFSPRAHKMDSNNNCNNNYAPKQSTVFKHNQQKDSSNYMNYELLQSYQQAQQQQRRPSSQKAPALLPRRSNGPQRIPQPPPSTASDSNSRGKTSTSNYVSARESSRGTTSVYATPAESMRSSSQRTRPMSSITSHSLSSTQTPSSSSQQSSPPLYGNHTNVHMRVKQQQRPQVDTTETTAEYNRDNEVPRRHTVVEETYTAVNDARMEKVSTLMTEEREVLRRGMQNCERTVDWFHKRLGNIRIRQKLTNNASTVPLEQAVHEERLNYLRAHVTELNARQNSLMESSERAFPSHSNREKMEKTAEVDHDQMKWMHSQNKLLTQDINEKNRELERIRLENGHLMKRLFEGVDPIYGKLPSTINHMEKVRPPPVDNHYHQLPLHHNMRSGDIYEQATLI